MPSVTRGTIAALALTIGITIAAAAGWLWSGTYDVGADAEHWRSTHALLDTLRERSIDVRANALQVPADLDDPARIRQGAGNYAAMCTGCHLAPGMEPTEMSRGLYPAPPDLAKQTVDAAHAFWVIKHGIKASGMPAWGKSMDDVYIWNMAAFLQALPKLSAGDYEAMVASSGGHAHGGETMAHTHDDGMEEHHEPEGHHHETEAATAPKPHSHPPGTPPHDDSRPPATDAAAPAVPSPHDHQH